MTIYIIIIVSTVVISVAADQLILRFFTTNSFRQHASMLKEKATKEADSIVKEAQLKAKNELLKRREEFDHSTQEQRHELKKIEQRLSKRESKMDQKMDFIQNCFDDITRRDTQLENRSKRLQEKETKVDELVSKEVTTLETIAAMSQNQARIQLIQKLENELIHDRGTLIRRHRDELKKTVQKQSQKILIQSMQRLASDCTYERTTATIVLPNDEIKGRIIGREGRNIRVFEQITGVNVLVDDTPSAVVISCFEPLRREIARIALERLISDGRIHPTRIEELVIKIKDEVKKDTFNFGNAALYELDISNVSKKIVETLGSLHFRYSFSQNVLKHSVEVAYLMKMIASELGLDSDKAKRMGLFHDIGKALTHEVEGPHAIIGMSFLKRFNEDSEVLNGIGCHHGDIAAQTPLAELVSVCDTLSASRPGARIESTEIYFKRLKKLEAIGNSFRGVESCYAIQAGREVRIIVSPEKVNEKQAMSIAYDIAKQIENEMTYPGQIRVSVIRETRAIEYAK